MKAAVSRLVHDAPGYFWPRAVGHGGFQVARAAWQHFKHQVRSGFTAGEYGWQRDGIVVLPSFLPIPTFMAVLREYGAVEVGDRRRRVWEEGGVHNDALVVRIDDPVFEATRAFAQSPMLRGFVEAFAGRGIEYLPQTVSFLRQIAVAPFVNDGNSFLHADVHYPTVKAVLYLNDVGPHGAPFLYAYGSHRLSWRRLAMEYKLAELRRAGKEPRLSLHDEARLDVRPVIAPANTLIVADHCGFHARGPLAVGHSRLTLRMSFRYLESPRYRLRRLLGMPTANKHCRRDQEWTQADLSAAWRKQTAAHVSGEAAGLTAQEDAAWRATYRDRRRAHEEQ